MDKSLSDGELTEFYYFIKSNRYNTDISRESFASIEKSITPARIAQAVIVLFLPVEGAGIWRSSLRPSPPGFYSIEWR